ncbi:MAG: replication-relaxation family protein [Acidimicrobiia bacterium]
MTVATTAARAVALSPVGNDVLTSLYRHRLLSTSQIRAIHAPEGTARGVRKTLARLVEGGYVDRVGVSGTPETAWFVTPLGVEAVEGSGVAARPYRMTPERARGPLQSHTIAVNDVGIAFLEAARRRGDDFDANGWRHETAHPITEGRKPELLIADAVIDYTVHESDGEIFLCRFVEVDRGTMSVREVAAKLTHYARLYHFRPAADTGWRQHYPRFPKVLVVLCGKPHPVLERRLRSLLEMARRDPELVGLVDELGISVTTLEQLAHRGPFAPIFWRLGGAVGPVDVLGRRPGETAR